MAAWVCIPCLLTLRAEFNAVSPTRDKGADGTIGDSAHTSTSDHTPDEDSDYLRDHDADSKNEVHALDIDSSGPWPTKTWFNDAIEKIRREEKRRWLDPNDKCRLKYIIWNRRIASQSSDFEWRAYSGSDPHTNHVHFSGRYETVCENDTRPWGVAPAQEEDEMNEADFTKIRTIVREECQAEIRRVFTDIRFPWSADNPADKNSYQRNAGDLMGDVWFGLMKGTTRGGDPIPDAGVMGRLLSGLAELNAKIDALDAPVVTKEVVRAAMIDIITGNAPQ